MGPVRAAGTPSDVVDRLNGEAAVMLADADFKARIAADGAEPGGGAPREFAAFLRIDYDKWGAVVKQAGIRPE